MALLTFSAHCAKGHDRIDFTDREAFEAHMTGDHKAKRKAPGGAGVTYSNPQGVAAPGWSNGKPSEPFPWKAPSRTPGGIERVAQRIAAGEYEWPGASYWFPAGIRQGKGTPAAEVA